MISTTRFTGVFLLLLLTVFMVVPKIKNKEKLRKKINKKSIENTKNPKNNSRPKTWTVHLDGLSEDTLTGDTAPWRKKKKLRK
jgi:hypothetical protein